MKDKNCNSAAAKIWDKIMQNRFGWSDRNDVNIGNEIVGFENTFIIDPDSLEPDK